MKLPHALLALTLAAAPLAHAQNSARAAITQIVVDLTDLAPDDGIAPSFVYADRFPNDYRATTAIDYGPRRNISAATLEETDGNPWANQHLEFDSATLPGHQGARVTGATSRTGSSLETIALAAVAGTQGAGGNWLESRITNNVQGFTLSPHTALSLTFSYDLQAAVDPRASVWDNGLAYAFVHASFLALTPTWAVGEYRERGYMIDGPRSWGEAGPQTFTIAFANTADVAIETNLHLYIVAEVVAPLAPVPEPSAYALLGAGLGVIGLLGRRRQARQAAR